LDVSSQIKPEVDDLPGPRRHLLVVERHEDVLRVATVDPVAVAVEHVDVNEVGIGVDGSVVSDPSRSPDDAAPGGGGQFDPDLVRVDRPLTERMAEPER